MPQAPTPPRPAYAYALLLIVVFASATGPLAIRQAQSTGVPSLYIIATRITLTALILAPYVLRRYPTQLRRLQRRDWLILFLSGLLFALNLIFLFLSLEYASVLVTGMVRRTSPFWVIWLEMFFLGAVFSRFVWVGLGVTVVGSVLVALGNASAVGGGSQPLLGMALALTGAFSMGVYLLIGRAMRHRLPSLLYSWLIFCFAGGLTWLAVFAFGVPLGGYSPAGYTWIIIVTLITQFLGHIPINLSLRHFTATNLSLILQAGVVLGAILAFFLFNEIPSTTQIIGSGAIMLGVGLIIWQ